jgi:(S)-ureidoglycine aminohydrolase
MRPSHQLVHSRARVGTRYALFPLEGYPTSRIPGWDCDARVLASPALGAQFVEYLFDIPPGKGTGQGEALEQVFGYVLSGTVRVFVAGEKRDLSTGGYFFVPEKDEWELTAREHSKLLLLRKRFEQSEILARTGAPESIIGNSADVPATPFADNPHTRLQLLIPDRVEYDFAMNIFTFDPGYGLPYVETHVMEHGLYFLEGKGLYYLQGEWMEVQKDDFIWMGPYCPQSFYATGPTPSRYLYYKNVNREIPL